ncbi:MAG TPA: MarR family winged helix-turn-helix transcriptional regulator [Burkholderiales bacterium]|nr:MarR family winged helix-turn-helix transcriptional regulator [Burkholderiales bacterium]
MDSSKSRNFIPCRMRLTPKKHDKLKRARGELKAGVLSELIGYRLRVAQQAVFRDFASQVGELSPGRAGIMLLIEANPGVAQGRLAEAVRLDRSTMVGVVDSLEERGLIERRRGHDRRTNGLWLTPAGRALALRLRRRIARHERRVAARLTDAERAQLLFLLGKLAA